MYAVTQRRVGTAWRNREALAATQTFEEDAALVARRFMDQSGLSNEDIALIKVFMVAFKSRDYCAMAKAVEAME